MFPQTWVSNEHQGRWPTWKQYRRRKKSQKNRRKHITLLSQNLNEMQKPVKEQKYRQQPEQSLNAGI